jgi:hypothetical protein
MKPPNTLCGKNAELLIVKAGGTYSSHLTLKDLGDQVKDNEIGKTCSTNER